MPHTATRAAILLLVGLLPAACHPGSASVQTDPPRHVQVSGTTFVTAGRPFSWRGITAFRLLEYVARGKEAEADRFLSWAESQQLTVVRVLAMGQGFMNLSPSDGRTALPRLLEMAATHKLHVEIVALAGTRDVAVDLDEHLSGIGLIAARHANAILEIANEPVHPSQSADVQRADVLARLRTRVPREVPVALGSVERGDGFAAGDYVTWHVPREDRLEGWGHVLAIAQGADIVRRWNKPVVSDEPIGAGARYEPGRRDDTPTRFRAAALLTRLAGLGATFHYERGLQATIPDGRELECFTAWNEAWKLLPADIESSGTFRRAGDAGAAVAGFRPDKGLAVFERQVGDAAWIVAINPREDLEMRWSPGWTAGQVTRLQGAWVLTARRDSVPPSLTAAGPGRAESAGGRRYTPRVPVAVLVPASRRSRPVR